MLKEKRGMEAEKLCLTDGMVQYISAALLLATRPPRSKKNLLKNMKSKGKKATIAFFYKSHSLFYLPVVVYHCLFRNANTGKKTTQSGYCGGAELAAVVVVAARNALVKMSGPLVSHRYTPQTGLTPTLVPMRSNKSTKNVF